ncbi:MAG TPA: hypothetical protein VN951_16410 [Pyrinomonadaceae bacterium]|nr:hypothetical protein [Pyrinomonadaceae bacterium]
MLKKASITLLIVIACCALAFGFQLPSDWVSFNSPEGRFSVGMPNKPAEDVKEVDSVVGKLQLHSFTASNAVAYFMVSYGDYPNEPTADRREKVLDGVRDGVVSSLEGGLISETKTTIDGYPGREFLAKKTVDGDELIFNWHIYLVGPRLYQVAAVAKKSDSTSPEITKFFNSFRLTN